MSLKSIDTDSNQVSAYLISQLQYASDPVIGKHARLARSYEINDYQCTACASDGQPHRLNLVTKRDRSVVISFIELNLSKPVCHHTYTLFGVCQNLLTPDAPIYAFSYGACRASFLYVISRSPTASAFCLSNQHIHQPL
ncbi:hypothetical protein ACTXT7_012108 [Hymenolepis weldensis]